MGKAWIVATGAAALAIGAGAPASPARDAFTIDLVLTPRAAAKLAGLGESVTVAAYYSGEPRPAYRRHADEEGKIDLGEEMVTAPGHAGPVRVSTAKLARAHLGWIKGAPEVLINVYSARRRAPDNLLNCGIYEGPLPAIAGATHTIRCDLIGR